MGRSAKRVSAGSGAVPMSGGAMPPPIPAPAFSRAESPLVEREPASKPPVLVVVAPSPACSGQIATATIPVAAKATSNPTMAAIRLIIRWVPQGADQGGGDHHDDQQRDRVEADCPDVAVGPQAQPRVDDHVDGQGGEEPAEEQAEHQQGVPEIGVQFRSVDG